VPAADRATMEQAIKAADTAFAGWSQTPLEQRIRVIEQLHAGLKERSDEIAEVVSREVGMPIKLAKGIRGRAAGYHHQQLPGDSAGLSFHRTER
jgi:NAD-dependent aldehyde dehydrogenases